MDDSREETVLIDENIDSSWIESCDLDVEDDIIEGDEDVKFMTEESNVNRITQNDMTFSYPQEVILS